MNYVDEVGGNANMGMRIGIVRGILTAAAVTCTAAVSQAGPMMLTSDALGLSHGNYGYSFEVNDQLTLTGRSMIGSWDETDGLDGTVYLGYGDKGVGVRGFYGEGSYQMSGDGYWGMEALGFNFENSINMAGVEVGLNWYQGGDDGLCINVIGLDGDVTTIVDDAVINSAITVDGSRHATLRLEALGESFAAVSGFSIQATKGHFYIDSLKNPLTDPIPEPASLWLVGTSLLGFVGWRRFRS